MLRRNKSKDKHSDAPGPAFMNSQQMTDYLNDLRTNRPTRPTGARPPPSSFRSVRHSIAGSPFLEQAPDSPTAEDDPLRSRRMSGHSTHRKTSSSSFAPSLTLNLNPNVGRPVARSPSGSVNDELMDDLPYQESNARRKEKQEARSLRVALQEMDLAEEEKLHEAAQKEASELVWKHQNPQNPQNPNAPYRYNESQRQGKVVKGDQSIQDGVVVRKSRTEKNVVTGDSRTASSDIAKVVGTQTSSATSSRVPSDSSMKSSGTGASDGNKSRRKSVQFATSVVDKGEKSAKAGVTPAKRRSTSSERKKGVLSQAESVNEQPKSVSPAKVGAAFGSAHFRNPFSRIKNARASLSRPASCPPGETKRPYLERVEIQRNPPTQSRNPAYTMNSAPLPKVSIPVEDVQAGAEEPKIKDGKEIRGDDIRKATSMSLKDRSAKLPTPSLVSDTPGRPIVSFQKDWKPKEVNLKEETSALPPLGKTEPYQAKTSGGQPAKPPSPPLISVTNDRANPFNRPEVNHGSRESLRNINNPLRPQQSLPSIPVINVFESEPKRNVVKPPIPTICLPDDPAPSRNVPSRNIPSIAVSPSTPAINILPPSITINAPTIAISPPTIAISPPTIAISSSDGAPNTHQPASTRPLPTPGKPGSRPLPSKASTGYTQAGRPSWATPLATTGHSSILCHACALPIAGRIVTAAGVRFHPACFRCYHCAEALECVAFYPEPEGKRAERLARHEARLRGEALDEDAGSAANDDDNDGDPGQRFYCHLDFHEFFSPRCKSCKTPIEGDVVVACGASWHAGHFFCAQCGDPFEATTPFVEKEGYAWCVNCHTNRFSTKCRKCRKPVTDVVVKALGAEWHEECFCCAECGGRFADGRYFLRQGGEEPFCPSCEERRLKA